MDNIFIAGHNGMVGSSILEYISLDNTKNIITASRNELDLIDQKSVEAFFKKNNIDEVYLCAAKVGGIHANNTYPAEFLYENLMIQTNIIHSAFKNEIPKLLFLGSSCIYPKNAKQPIKESYLLSNKLEETNYAYAIAKIAGIKLCRAYSSQYNLDYRSVMPCNLYGPGDNFHQENSHVIPALIKKIHNAKINKLDHVLLWGTGSPLREFLHVHDMAKASIYINNVKKEIFDEIVPSDISLINIGAGEDISIKDLALKLSSIIGYDGEIRFDQNQNMDGTKRKLLNTSLAGKLGWKKTIDLDTGLKNTYFWFKNNINQLRNF